MLLPHPTKLSTHFMSASLKVIAKEQQDARQRSAATHDAVAVGQAEGERVIREIYPKATIFKAAHMTGVEDRLLNNFANLAKKLPFMPLVEGGQTLYQPTYVRDVTEAMMNSLKTPNAVGQTYHLAGPETYT